MIKNLLTVVAIAVIAACVTGLYFRFFGALPVAVTQTQKASTFDVTGEGSITVEPDEVQVTLGIEKSAPVVSSAQSQVNKEMNNLSAQLKDLGVVAADIRTTQYSVYPQYRPVGAPSGYTVSTSVLVKIHDFTKVGPILDVAGQLGLNKVGGLVFTLSDGLKEKTLSQARKQAIEAAKTKARELAILSGMRLGRIVNVSEGTTPDVQPLQLIAAGIDKATTPSTPTEISPGMTAVKVTETLSYETQ